MYRFILAAIGIFLVGTASNIVNIVLCVVVFFTGRHYVSIGTFIYIIPYGIIVDLGGRIYHMLFKVQTFPIQIFGAVIGCLLLYTGVITVITALSAGPVIQFLAEQMGKMRRRYGAQLLE